MLFKNNMLFKIIARQLGCSADSSRVILCFAGEPFHPSCTVWGFSAVNFERTVSNVSVWHSCCRGDVCEIEFCLELPKSKNRTGRPLCLA